ncbi:MAG: hypothetical protein ACK4KV_01085 [Rhodocyclaceae bacterium]
MAETASTPEGRFLHRIERRIAFLKTVQNAELGLYLSPDAQQRKHTIEQLVRLTARQSELPYLRPETLRQAEELMTSQLEAMQKVLPHDVQYRNRLKQIW